MSPTAIRNASHFRRFLATASALLATAALVACDPGPASTDAEADGGAVEDVDTRPATVVFESGLGDDSSPWDEVAAEVAVKTQVFTYSRPGYGGTEPSLAPRNATRIVEDLRARLATHGIAPPYILVGHSFGGAYMELFAKAHPEEVAGLVLVDTRHRDFAAACEDAGLDGCTIPAEYVPTLPPVPQAEYLAFSSTSEEIRDSGAFGSYPVRVLTSTSHGFEPTVETLWQTLHGSLADEAADGEQIVFPRAGHYLQTERAHEVAEVILSLIPASEE